MNKFKTAAAVAVLTLLAAAPAVVHAAEGTAISGGYEITEAGNYYIDSDMSGDIAIKNKAGGNVMLDLNGHTFTSSAQEAIENYGTLTIKDSVGTGSVIGTGDDAIFNKGTLTVESGTFAGGNYNALYNSSGTATINGGTFTSSSSTIYVEDGSTVYIKGGTYTSTNNYSAATDSGTLEISGGTFNSKIKATKITMGTYTVPVEMAGGEISGGAFSNTVTGSGTTTISDGTFSGAVSSVSTISGGIFNGTVKSPTTVNGGTFNGTVKSPTTVNGGTFNGTIDSWTTASKKWTDYTSPDTVTVGENCSVASYTDGCAVVTIDDVRRIKYVDRGRIYLYKGSNCSSFSAIKTDSTNQYIFYVNANGTDTYLTTSTSYTYATIGTKVKIKAKTTGTAATEDYEYVFKGWYTNSAGTGTLVSENESFEYTPSSTSAVYLYAVYEKTETAAVAAKKELANTWLNENGGYSSTSFNITSEDDMLALAYSVNFLNYDFYGKTITLTKDLDFTNKTYMAIAKNTTTNEPPVRFRGTFDGGDHTISNITLTNSASNDCFVGVFGYARNATIKNLTVSNSSFSAMTKTSPYIGVFAGGTLSVKMTNCKSINNTISNGYFAGGMVGHSEYDTFTDSVVSGLTIASVSWKTGGMIGYIDETTIDGATVSGITAPSTAGSLVGHVNYGKTNIKNVNVNSPNLYLINMTYATPSVKTITFSDNNIVVAKGIVDSFTGNPTFNITGGTYTVDTILNTFGNSSGTYIPTLNITGGTFNGISTVYNKITDLATANIDMNNTVGLTEELLSQCTDAGGFVQDSEGNWVLEKANVIASAPDTQSEKLRTNIDAYVDEEGFGNLRVITDVELVKSVEIEKFGTWFIPTEQYDENKLFEGGKTVEQEINTTMTFADAQFAADLMKIPAEYLGTSITAVSYVKPVGDLEIRTVLFATTINEAMQHHRDLETTEVD